MRKIAFSFVTGVVVTLGSIYHLGSEAIIQAGLKMAAMQASYDFVSVPREATEVSYDTRGLVPAPTSVAKRVARR